MLRQGSPEISTKSTLQPRVVILPGAYSCIFTTVTYVPPGTFILMVTKKITAHPQLARVIMRSWSFFCFHVTSPSALISRRLFFPFFFTREGIAYFFLYYVPSFCSFFVFLLPHSLSLPDLLSHIPVADPVTYLSHFLCPVNCVLAIACVVLPECKFHLLSPPVQVENLKHEFCIKRDAAMKG
jgi:hypothetical protein